MNRIIEEIHCQDDDGEYYTVHIFQEFKIVRDLDGLAEEWPGMKFAVLAGTADRVNLVDGKYDAFQIVKTDRIIRRVID